MRHHTTHHGSRATAAAQKLSCIGFCRIPMWTPRLERCTRGTSDLGLCNAKKRVPKERAQQNERTRRKGVQGHNGEPSSSNPILVSAFACRACLSTKTTPVCLKWDELHARLSRVCLMAQSGGLQGSSFLPDLHEKDMLSVRNGSGAECRAEGVAIDPSGLLRRHLDWPLKPIQTQLPHGFNCT